MALVPNTLRGRYSTNWPRIFEMDKHIVEISSATTLVADTHCGKALVVTATAVITLPASVAGVPFTIYNGGQKQGQVQITITPDGAETIGGDGNTSANVDVVNTLATAKPGDRIKLMGNGNGAWMVDEIIGTWDWGS